MLGLLRRHPNHALQSERKAVSSVINKVVVTLKKGRKSQSSSSGSGDSQKSRKNAASNFNKSIRGGLIVVKNLIRIHERECKTKKAAVENSIVLMNL